MIELLIWKNIVALKRAVWVGSGDLGTLSTDSPGKLDVLWHDGHPLGMDGAQVGVLEKTNQVCLARLLQGHHSRALESQVSLEVLSNLTDKTLEGQFPDEQLSRFLVSSDLPESNSSWPVSVRLLHSSSSWGTLASSLSRQLLPWRLSSGRFASGLLSTSHDRLEQVLSAIRTSSSFYNVVQITRTY